MSEKGLSISFGHPRRPEPMLNIEHRFIGWVDRIEFELEGQALVVKKLEVRAEERMPGVHSAEQDIPPKYRHLIELIPPSEHGVIHLKVEKEKKHG